MELVEGEDLRGAHRAGAPIAARRGAADREADRRGARSRARAGHHPSRPEAREHQGPRRRHGEGARLRSRESDRAGGPARRRERHRVRRRFTTPAMTQAGMILGTAAYMAPEQARGRAVDKRADIWAFGAVLFEMLTGARAFPGDDLTDTLAAVVRAEPDWTLLPPACPRRSSSTCSAACRRTRSSAFATWRDAPGARGRVRHGRTAGDGARPRRVAPVARPVWASAAIAIGSLAVAAFALWSRPADVQPSVGSPDASRSGQGSEITSSPAITRDGRTVAYVAQQGTEDPQLYLRDLDSFEARAVAGSSGARQPFFSPDGKWVAFFAQGQLQKAEVTGGAPSGWPKPPIPSVERGTRTTPSSTRRRSAPDSCGFLPAAERPSPSPSPTARPTATPTCFRRRSREDEVLFTIWGQNAGQRGALPGFGPMGVGDAARRRLRRRSSTRRRWQRWPGTGRLLLVDETAGVRAAPFDPRRPARTSADASVLDNVYSEISTESRAWLAISINGTAVYASGNPSRTSLVVGRPGGKDRAAAATSRMSYREVSISPDGVKARRQAAVSTSGFMICSAGPAAL